MPLFDNEITIQEVANLQATLDEKAQIDHTHPPEAWQNIPLSSNWANFGTGFATPQCRKLVGNLIEVKGTIRKATAVIANETIATLPSGYRPTDTRYFTTWSYNGYSRLQVEPTGEIKLSISGSNPNTALNFVFGLN